MGLLPNSTLLNGLVGDFVLQQCGTVCTGFCYATLCGGGECSPRSKSLTGEVYKSNTKVYLIINNTARSKPKGFIDNRNQNSSVSRFGLVKLKITPHKELLCFSFFFFFPNENIQFKINLF